MASEQNVIYVKSGTATATATALETAHPTKYDHWVLKNTHGAKTLTVTINGSPNLIIAAGEAISLDITASPNNITVDELSCTYRFIGTGR
tara:strand:+ start:615 stop:884 length:270 start_codon:yes stop_codon:yes gene_type:complete